jgi:triacylglycerol lipase
MSPSDESLEKATRMLAATGRGLAALGRFVGSRTAAAYRGIDPDLRRHMAQLPLMSYSLFSRGAKPVEALPSDGHPPLVFVHGLGGGRGDFAPMAWYLRFMGRQRSYAIRLQETGDVVARAAELATFVNDVLAVTHEPCVDMVAHSLGGVVARVAILDHKLGKKVRRLVTLGSPHFGTYAARLGNTPVTHDLRPDSDFMTRLNSRRLPRSVTVSSCWSKSDLVIMPQESAALEGARQVELTPLTHYGYLIHPRAWAAVSHALG